MSEVGLSWKKIIFNFYLLMRCFFYLAFLVAVTVYTSQINVGTTHLVLSQIILMSLSILIFSKQAKMSNQKIKSLQFLLGRMFTKEERLINIKKVGRYYAIYALGTFILVDTAILPYFLKSGIRGVLLMVFCLVITTYYVYSKTVAIMDIKRSETPRYPWYISYFIVATVTLMFPKLLKSSDINQLVGLSSFGIIVNVIFTLLIIHILMFLIIKRNPALKNIEEKRNFRGMTQEFFEGYIKGAAFWLIIPAGLLGMLPISEISKAIAFVTLLSFLLMPNICSKPMINYLKMIGWNKKLFLIQYGYRILFFLLVVQVILNIFVRLSLTFFMIGLVLTTVLVFSRIIVGIFIMESGHSDNKKIDYYGLFVITSVFLFAMLAYMLREL
ncbi:hypothetical protein [Lactococcus ileimucosae]|uniref:hypothetical protein n=1 Tax=Lactococcus ileimucosae TaxID=2941329 RepID=UPI0035195AA1